MEYKVLADEIRSMHSWLDYMNEGFNSHFVDIKALLELKRKRNYDMVDDMLRTLYETEEWKDYLHDAKLVNKAMRKEYYPTNKAKAVEAIRLAFDEDFNID